MNNLTSKIISVIDAFDRINRYGVVLEMAGMIDEHFEPDYSRFGLNHDLARLMYLSTMVNMYKSHIEAELEDLKPVLDELQAISNACIGENPLSDSGASPEITETAISGLKTSTTSIDSCQITVTRRASFKDPIASLSSVADSVQILDESDS